MKLNLVVAQGAREGKVIPVAVAPFLIGRDPDCQLRPSSEAVSKRHCALLVKGERAVVRDLKSKNGTFVNDKKVEGDVELRDGDRLKVGPLLFKVKLVTTGKKPVKKGDADDDAASFLLEGTGSSGNTSDNESDRIAAMLLDMDDSGTTSADDIPTGNTEVELPALSASEPVKDAKAPPPAAKGKEKPKEPDTASAAKAILDMYARRTRP